MQESSFQSPVSQLNYTSPQSGKKSKKSMFIILFIILFILLVFALQRFFFASSSKEESDVITPTPTEFQFPTDTPAPQPSPEEEPTPTKAASNPTDTSTPKPTTNPVDKATGLDRSTLTVEVQNGSGVTGAAAKASDVLKSFGYKVSAIGNADNENYENVTIQVKSTKSNYLSLLKKDLGFSYTIGSTSADLSSSSTADALVVIGK